jgi:hypothetical protein
MVGRKILARYQNFRHQLVLSYEHVDASLVGLVDQGYDDFVATTEKVSDVDNFSFEPCREFGSTLSFVTATEGNAEIVEDCFRDMNMRIVKEIHGESYVVLYGYFAHGLLAHGTNLGFTYHTGVSVVSFDVMAAFDLNDTLRAPWNDQLEAESQFTINGGQGDNMWSSYHAYDTHILQMHKLS